MAAQDYPLPPGATPIQGPAKGLTPPESFSPTPPAIGGTNTPSAASTPGLTLKQWWASITATDVIAVLIGVILIAVGLFGLGGGKKLVVETAKAAVKAGA